MEIEKKRETSWKIQLENASEYIELTSVEVSGEVRLVKLSLSNNDQLTKVEMNKDKFFKFLSLISAFKDVVIGEDSIILENGLTIIESKNNEEKEFSKREDNLYQVTTETSKSLYNKEKEKEDLDPKEWDPW